MLSVTCRTPARSACSDKNAPQFPVEHFVLVVLFQAKACYIFQGKSLVICVKRNKRNELSLELPDDEEDYRTVEVSDERYDPQAIVEQSDLRESLASAIAELPQQQREMIVLRDIQGLSYEEIGQVLCLESGTVKSRLSRARENLRKKLLQSGNIFGTSPSKLSKGGKTDAIL